MEWLSQVMCLLKAPGANERSHHQYSALFTRSSFAILPGKFKSKHLTRRHRKSRSLDAFFPSEAENSRPHSEPPGMCCLCESDDARSDSVCRFRVLDGPTLLRDRLCHQNGWIRTASKGGGVFSIQLMLQILDLQTGLSEHEIIKELQHDFSEMRGWIKGCLERFRKFIRFGDGVCPH